ncbi:mitochondrial basic amino acids transporter-like [Artemia franciscana]|uniref:Mitochondrial basic amino acids transporter n=1 Tax=Artemia franciscana TaxID=6661 RepID=A0AA88HFA7_ARTSF|nr:hypothetical protein QYM36_015643 [Artemia franciscana]
MDDFIAGFAGGCAGVIIGYPLDTVKVRIQTQDPRNLRYTGTFQCLRTVVRHEGAAALFRGMTSPMAGVAGINAMIFGVYGNVNKRLSDPESIKSIATAGICAGLAQTVITSPMELVKTRLQVQSQIPGAQISEGPVDCLKKIWRSYGIRGVYQGFGITCVREIPAFGIYFAAYEVMTRQSDPSVPLSTWTMLYAGGMAGVYSWAFTYPVDMVKSRLQIDGISGKQQYSGAIDCIRKTYHSEGIRVFFRGLSATVIRAFPSNAATFAVVTWTLRLIRSENERTLDKSAIINAATPFFGASSVLGESIMRQFSRNLFLQYALIEPWETNVKMCTKAYCDGTMPKNGFTAYCGIDDSDEHMYVTPSRDDITKNLRY